MSRNPVARIWAFALAVVAFAVLYGSVLVGLARDWMQDPNYAHGILVIPIAFYFAWQRRAAVAQLPIKPSWVGSVIVLASLAVLMVGTAGIEFFLTRISMLGVLAGAVVFLLGWAHLWQLAFPLGFLALMIPLPAIVFNQIGFPLQLLASRLGMVALESLHIPVLREGNVIILANTTLEVAEACSGIRSLMSLVTVAIVYGRLMEHPRTARIMLAFSAVPIAIVANGTRVAGIGVLAQYYGPSAATGFLHGFSGWLLFAFAFVMLIGCGGLIGAARRWFEPGLSRRWAVSQ